MAKFLLISRVGPSSRHKEWLEPTSRRNYDVFLSAYSKDVVDPDVPNVRFEYRPGSKVAGFADLFAAHAELIAQFDYIALFDDDLSFAPETLSSAFELCEAWSFKIAQPALTKESFFTYAGLLQQPNLKLRNTTFIEMMAPIFRSDILAQTLPLFDLGFESGLDLIWCNTCYEQPTDFAVIDAHPVFHTLPVGGQMAKNGFSDGRVYEDDIYELLARFELPWIPCVPYQAVTSSGKIITSKVALFAHAFGLASVLLRSRNDPGRVRKVLTHWKHVLLSKPKNIQPVVYSDRVAQPDD